MDAVDQERLKVAADADREMVRLWRAWRTVHEMCQDRVYTPLSFRLSLFSLKEQKRLTRVDPSGLRAFRRRSSHPPRRIPITVRRPRRRTRPAQDDHILQANDSHDREIHSPAYSREPEPDANDWDRVDRVQRRHVAGH